jgi:hypothetical protein
MTDEHGKRCVITARPSLLDGDDPLSRVDPNELADGCLCFVHENESLYVYLASGRSRPDPPDVIKARDGRGQWERTTCKVVG